MELSKLDPLSIVPSRGCEPNSVRKRINIPDWGNPSRKEALISPGLLGLAFISDGTGLKGKNLSRSDVERWFRFLIKHGNLGGHKIRNSVICTYLCSQRH